MSNKCQPQWYSTYQPVLNNKLSCDGQQLSLQYVNWSCPRLGTRTSCSAVSLDPVTNRYSSSVNKTALLFYHHQDTWCDDETTTMVRVKNDFAAMCLENNGSAPSYGSRLASTASATSAESLSANSEILQSLFQARTALTPEQQRNRPLATNERPVRVSPLLSLSKTSLFSACQRPSFVRNNKHEPAKRWNPNCLLHKL